MSKPQLNGFKQLAVEDSKKVHRCCLRILLLDKNREWEGQTPYHRQSLSLGISQDILGALTLLTAAEARSSALGREPIQ